MHVSKRVLKAYPLFIETLEDGLHEVTCSMPENTIVNAVCTAEAHVYNTGSKAEQWHCKNSTSLGEHYKTNPAFFVVLWQDIDFTSALKGTPMCRAVEIRQVTGQPNTC